MRRERIDAYIVTGVISVAAGILITSYLYSRQRSQDPLLMAEKIVKECREKIEEIEKDLVTIKTTES
ncbi:MAG: hypothetical protein PHD91_02535 [bacterium]|jgi:predicted small secreted protein|nr:hypothetical protein [bacterium]MDD3805990.1 hypothetical protein [bacterium]MDD4152581.1 hypothetical protein [bacterium]MDD4558325.1 hypothetical protein [bacterium]